MICECCSLVWNWKQEECMMTFSYMKQGSAEILILSHLHRMNAKQRYVYRSAVVYMCMCTCVCHAFICMREREREIIDILNVL
jgi:hypothetical protein